MCCAIRSTYGTPYNHECRIFNRLKSHRSAKGNIANLSVSHIVNQIFKPFITFNEALSTVYFWLFRLLSFVSRLWLVCRACTDCSIRKMLIVANSFRILELFLCGICTVNSVLCMRQTMWRLSLCSLNCDCMLGIQWINRFFFFWFCYTFQIAVFLTLVMWYKLTEPVLKFLNRIPII